MNASERKSGDLRIGVITFPVGAAGRNTLLHLLEILTRLSPSVELISGGHARAMPELGQRLNLHEVKHRVSHKRRTRMCSYLRTQLMISYMLVSSSKKVDVWVFFIGGDTLVIPMILARILRRDVVIDFAGSSFLTLEAKHDSFSKLLRVLSIIGSFLSRRLVLYSHRLIDEWGLQMFENRVRIAHGHFVDFDKFRKLVDLEKRDLIVGYVGRLDEEKGVVNLVSSFQRVSEAHPNARFTIVGDGSLSDTVRDMIVSKGLSAKVTTTGWIDHDELPRYLNELKLMVVPSYTEGLPNVMLEAMACETPILASRVGAIQDFIVDEETGFLMEDTLPETISANIIRALNHPSLKEIAKNAHRTVVTECTYEKGVGEWYEILKNL